MKYCEKCGGCTPSYVKCNTCVHCRAPLNVGDCAVFITVVAVFIAVCIWGV